MSQEGADISLPELKPALKFALDTYTKNFFLLIGAFYVAISIGQALFSSIPEPLGGMLTVVYGSFFTGGLISIVLAFQDGSQPQFSLLFSKTNQFWKYIVAHIVASLACGLGFVLLVIPGLFLMVKIGFYPAAIAERNDGPIAAMKYSWQITSGHFWKLVLFNLAIMVILLGPALVIGVGAGVVSGIVAFSIKASMNAVSRVILVFTLPVLLLFWQLCWVHCYRQLSRKAAAPVPTGNN